MLETSISSTQLSWRSPHLSTNFFAHDLFDRDVHESRVRRGTVDEPIVGRKWIVLILIASRVNKVLVSHGPSLIVPMGNAFKVSSGHDYVGQDTPEHGRWPPSLLLASVPLYLGIEFRICQSLVPGVPCLVSFVSERLAARFIRRIGSAELLEAFVCHVVLLAHRDGCLCRRIGTYPVAISKPQESRLGSIVFVDVAAVDSILEFVDVIEPELVRRPEHEAVQDIEFTLSGWGFSGIIGRTVQSRRRHYASSTSRAFNCVPGLCVQFFRQPRSWLPPESRSGTKETRGI